MAVDAPTDKAPSLKRAAPFRSKSLLVVFDDEGGLCGTVVPRMVEMLEQRAFEVETLELEGAVPEIDAEDYDGLILGSPATGLGIKGAGPTGRVREFLDAIEDLDELKVALFCVYQARPGRTLDNMSALVQERGGELVASMAYWVRNPTHDEHVIPAECMVRIR